MLSTPYPPSLLMLLSLPLKRAAPFWLPFAAISLPYPPSNFSSPFFFTAGFILVIDYVRV